MQVPLQITFRGMAPSDAITSAINEKAEKLERYHEHITGCHVVVETPHKHHHQGQIHHVKIHLTLPGRELTVDRDPEQHDHEDVYVSIRDAFDAAVRQIKDYTEKRAARR